MLKNRSWATPAFVGLVGIVFLCGCGSQSKAPAPSAENVDQGKEIAAAQEPSPSPGSESTDEAASKAADVQAWKDIIAEQASQSAAKQESRDAAKQSSEDDVEKSSGSAVEKSLGSAGGTSSKQVTNAKPKYFMKRAASSPTAHKPTSPRPGAVPSPTDTASPPPPPAAAEQSTNPVRGPTTASEFGANPMRQETAFKGDKFSEDASALPEESDLATGKKLFMRKMEDKMDVEPSESNDSVAASPAEPANDSVAASPAEPADDSAESLTSNTDYTVVKVFYGTDRSHLNPLILNRSVYLSWILRTIVVAVTTMFLSIMGFRFTPSKVIRGLAYTGMIATAMLMATAIYARIQASSVVDVAKSPPSAAISYGADRGKMELGTCEVSIPKSHEVGELESPSVLRLEFHQDPVRHVILRSVTAEPADQFFQNLGRCVESSSQKSAFVFVHGYNVTFEDAARRTAQIAYDLKFDGAPIFFSWPSQGGLLQYTVDETNVSWATPHLLKFLTDVAERSGAERIHLIAHSMGNRALTSALRDLSLSDKSATPKFQEIVLTAPDIDAETFINDIAPSIVKTARRVTLYASSNDEALVMSKKVHGYPRAGDSGGQLVVVPGVDTVDVSAIDTSLLGHTYYGDNSTVLADIFELLHGSTPADRRQWLHPQQLGALRYWVFQQ